MTLRRRSYLVEAVRDMDLIMRNKIRMMVNQYLANPTRGVKKYVYKDSDHPWSRMSPEDRSKADKLYLKYRQSVPLTPEAEKWREKLNKILIKYGLPTAKKNDA